MKSPILKIAYTSPWGTVHPGLQHTLIGDLVLSNQFEALIGMNDAGAPIPLAAKDWSISNDFTVFRFLIDRSIKFADGEPLSAFHFKRSWEAALRLDPTSANNSLLDVLYKIKGFEEFDKTGTISGIRVIDESTLEVHFSSPFRMALEHMQGNRFAAFKQVGDKFVGTGHFTIEELSNSHLRFIPNSTTENLETPALDVVSMPTKEAIAKIGSGDIDVLPYFVGLSDDIRNLNKENVEVLVGQDAVHLSIGLNSDKGIFSDRENRAAFQFLITEALKKNSQAAPDSELFQIDPQVFMPFQAGRLAEDTAKAIIDEGRNHVDKFKLAAKKHPISIIALRPNESLVTLIKSLGIEVSDESRFVDVREQIKIHYASTGPDVLISSFGVASGDPDGIYHKLGKNGAIRTPYIFSETVGQLLEEGRKIVTIDKINPFYQKISKAILHDVPLIHIGFAKAALIYRKDRVVIDTSVLRRNQGQLHFLRRR
jgi:ABC-type transport system substrate-binding protein